MRFELQHIDAGARAGKLSTARGEILTPVFMPVGTQGTVKAMEQRELQSLDARIILGNTYHLYLRPGVEIIERAGGLHQFIGWDRHLLTDSGGYQVFSLSDLRGIDMEGVTFKSHLDGSSHQFTPERVIDLQRSLGSDIMMVLDECPPYPCDEIYAARSHELTVNWARRSRDAFDRTKPLYGYEQAMFPIVQGSVYPHLRQASATALMELDADGYGIGGLSVGEPAELMYEMVNVCTAMLPQNRPRYLMGVGTPENILESIERGVDMFDCVLPTRNARNALVFTSAGKLNLRNAARATDFAAVDPDCSCYTCMKFSRAYLRHLFKAGEILALQLATIHNITYYLNLVRNARQAIFEGRFLSWKQETLRVLSASPAEH